MFLLQSPGGMEELGGCKKLHKSVARAYLNGDCGRVTVKGANEWVGHGESVDHDKELDFFFKSNRKSLNCSA